ncbi:sigma E protease regulator RseP [Pseudoalteromonas denitrificans]|uniref:Zinc metalloprotease n=1 Tax=Pseudoalteromonas denitrificans DSM 6059 TaxID=1123010 RepID=A0A1I1HHP0_9GAMM|nr:sigma E protease regulator RseP [Pseudoalteromonas denitrificans]SFC20993.1 site-2 protease. Metallo peptidase. MEROPS family M50B [Pseudoalteromonas denitrificans DSM 6059]
MFDFIWNLASFVLALGILVTVHEYGHFWVARKAGVKVLRFSIGFGKPLITWNDKLGTEYVIAAIPLGGYVKMLDERVEAVDENEKHLSFNSKPVLSRIAIVAAGPLANFAFAIILLWTMYMIGVQSIKPVIGDVEPDSRAFLAGIKADQTLISIAGETVFDWRETTFSLMQNMGEEKVEIIVNDPIEGQIVKNLNLKSWTLDDNVKSPIHAIGITPYRPLITTELAHIAEDSAAKKYGLKVGDKIYLIDGEKISNWPQLVKLIQASANKPLLMTISRGSEKLNIKVVPDNKPTKDGFSQGYLGVIPLASKWPESYISTRQYGLIDGFFLGVDKTWQMVSLSFEMIGNLLTGQVSVKNLSGPIGIAQGAGASVSYGLVAFLSFLALISVNLGVFNLLPLPILDGGHLMYYIIELIRKKPVSEKTQEFGFRIGALVLLLLTGFALFNDFMRL